METVFSYQASANIKARPVLAEIVFPIVIPLIYLSFLCKLLAIVQREGVC